jgi:hypothetical protein
MYEVISETLASEDEVIQSNPSGEFEIIIAMKDNQGKIIKKEGFKMSGTNASWRKYQDAINIVNDEG